jgi:hypothetical protein
MNHESLPSDDEWLDSAVQMVRDRPIPDGPSPALNARVIRNLAAMQNTPAQNSSTRRVGRALLGSRAGKLAVAAALLMLLLSNPFFKPSNIQSSSAAYGDELHTEQLQVDLLRMLYDLSATPVQLRELQAMSSNTLAADTEQPAEARAKAAPNFAEALTALHSALLSGNDDSIDAAETKVDDLADKYSLDEVDVEPTAAARSKAEAALALFNANQIAGYLAEYSDDVEDPAQVLVDAIGDCRGLGAPAFAAMRQTVGSKVGLLVAGLDTARAGTISRQVVDLLDKAHAGKAPEFAKIRADLESNARQIVGNVSAFDVLHHFMLGRMASLLSNPHLHAMLTLRLQNAK